MKEMRKLDWMIRKLNSTIVAARIVGYDIVIRQYRLWFYECKMKMTSDGIGIEYSEDDGLYMIIDRIRGGRIYSFTTIEELEKKLIDLL